MQRIYQESSSTLNAQIQFQNAAIKEVTNVAFYEFSVCKDLGHPQLSLQTRMTNKVYHQTITVVLLIVKSPSLTHRNDNQLMITDD